MSDVSVPAAAAAAAAADVEDEEEEQDEDDIDEARGPLLKMTLPVSSRTQAAEGD